MSDGIEIAGKRIGPGFPVFVVAELSGNHGHDYNRAVRLIEVAHEAGADAVKLQTYTPDTLTLDCANEYFRVGKGTLWEGRTLYDLYREAFTPWDWQPKLKEIAEGLGLVLFSTPFDFTAVEFLEKMNVPAYKIASFELVDLPLIRRVAQTGKPVILSVGMATPAEIDEAVRTAREAGARDLALLKCTSGYPARPEEMNLSTIPDLAARFGVVAGLSDHTLGATVSIAGVALGACIVEKHITLSRAEPGPDSAFSIEPQELKGLVDAIRETEKAIGQVKYEVGKHEEASRAFRRSLFVVADLEAGAVFDGQNVRSIRPGHGLHTRHLSEVIGKRAARSIRRGSPLEWSMIQR